MIDGNKQHDYITKEDDVSSPTVTAEAGMLTCVIDAQEDRDVAVVDIPNAFVQTVVSEEDRGHHVTVRIRGPLVDVLMSIAPDVYGPLSLIRTMGVLPTRLSRGSKSLGAFMLMTARSPSVIGHGLMVGNIAC